MAVDLFGDGRTALKATANRSSNRFGVEILQGVNPGNPREAGRLWRDFNGDGIVQGNPLILGRSGELIAPDGDPNFGQPVQTSFVDPDWAVGWGNRASNWEYSASVQHELLPRVSVSAGYFYRTFVNFSVEDDLSLASADFTEYSVFVPEGPGFPNGGGYTVTGLFDRNLDTVGRPPLIETTAASRLGGRSRTWKGMDLTLDARLEALLVQGGLSTGSTSLDSCELGRAVPETVDNPFCRTSTKWLTQVKFIGVYTFPYDIQVSGTFQSLPGIEREANWTFDASSTDLGRPLFEGVRLLNILEPGADYGARANLVDLRFTKILDLEGRVRVRPMLDLYNVFNDNTTTRENIATGENYLTPTAIVPGRLAKFAVQIDF